jgi:hypothetical protein
MTITKDQCDELLEAATPLIKWLNDNCDPHCSVEVTQQGAVLVEGIASVKTDEFLKD